MRGRDVVGEVGVGEGEGGEDGGGCFPGEEVGVGGVVVVSLELSGCG